MDQPRGRRGPPENPVDNNDVVNENEDGNNEGRHEGLNETLNEIWNIFGRAVRRGMDVAGVVENNGQRALRRAGFTPTGVMSGSVASSWQRQLGGRVNKGSTFAYCQSAGATGSTFIPSIVAGVAAGIVEAGLGIAELVQRRNQNEEIQH